MSNSRQMRRARERADRKRGQRIIDSTPLTPSERIVLGDRGRLAGYHRSDGHVEDMTQPIKPDKGEKGGSCNRTACQQPGANWYHHGNEVYYCQWCAGLLNEANRNDEFVRNLGQPLLTRDTLGEVTDPTL